MNHPASPRFRSPSRTLAALLASQLLLGGCSAAPQGTAVTWPEPATPLARNQPNFQAPSATHCARPIQTREVPGEAPWRQSRRGDAVPAPGVAGRALAATPALREEAAVASAAAPPAAAVADNTRAKAAAPAANWAQPAPSPSPKPLQRPRPAETVTAGMVDDNADFAAYLAFRARTQVPHRPRDVRERYLLEVRDTRGRGVPDAEVAVQATSGAAMWARTDSAGRAWLHPDAFDPTHARFYDVAVRKQGREAHGVLRRGQKSAVTVELGAAASAPARAQLDLVFLVDATGSMGDEIDKLKASLRSIAAEVAQLPSRPDLCLGLVAYRDKTDAFLLRSHDFTNDLDAFQGVLDALRADGGGDYPEAMNEALHETVHALSWRGDGTTRLVVLLADAPPHLDYGGPQYDEDMQAALGKGIKVFSVGASGLDRQGEYIQRQIAQYTGGRFVFLTYADTRRPASGPGRETVHDVRNYSVETLDRLVVRLVGDELAPLSASLPRAQ